MATIRGRRNTKSKRNVTKRRNTKSKRRNTKSKRRNTKSKSKSNRTKGGAKNVLLHQGQNPMHPQKYTKGECPICLEDIEEGGDFVETECKHLFHAECFLPLCDDVEKQRCPLCRESVKDLCTEIKEHLRKANSKKANRGG